MQPTQFKEQTNILEKPEGMTDEQCGKLPMFKDNQGNNVSRWKGSCADRFRFLFTGVMWLTVLSKGFHPPVALQTESPFSGLPEPTDEVFAVGDVVALRCDMPSYLLKKGQKAHIKEVWPEHEAVRVMFIYESKEAGQPTEADFPSLLFEKISK